MNDESPHDMTEHRLARDLRAAAGGVAIAPGSEVAVVANGRRRRQRRRQANAIMLVAATGIGTAFTIRQLARNGESTVATDTLPTTESTSSVPDSAVPAPTTPIGTTATPESTVPDAVPLETAPASGSDEPAPAQIIESDMVWNVIEPDSTKAVGYGDLSVMSSGDIPGVILATAPGRSDDYTPQLWRSGDGVNWTQTNIDVPFGQVYNARFSSDGVYAVGTAPGIAGTDPNPLMLGVSHDEGASWDQIQLPVDTNAGHDLPYVTGVASSATVYPIEGGAVVWLVSAAQLDLPALSAELGFDINDPNSLIPNFRAEGVEVPVDKTCQPVPSGSVPVFETPTTVESNSGFFGGCESNLVPWDQLGVPRETVDAAFNRTPREFRVIGDQVTELDVPAGVFVSGTTAEGPYFTTADGQWYRMGPDGVLVETAGPTRLGYPLGSNGNTDFLQYSPDGQLYGAYTVGIGASVDGGPWAYADWSDLAGEGQIAFPNTLAVTNAGVVEVLQSMTDQIAAAGGVSVSSGGFTATRASAKDPIVITNDATGEEVDLTRVWYGRDGVVIVDDAGNQVGAMDGPTFQSLFSDPSGGKGPADYLVAVSADGVHVSVESISQLLGVDAADISSVPRVTKAGNTTVIAVTMKDRNAEGVPRQMVLVGTPKS